MKQKHAHFVLAASLVALLNGCASPEQGQGLSNLSELKNATVADAASRTTPAQGSPVVLSKNGREVMYIKRTYSGSEGMTPQQIEWSKAFGTYEDVQNSVAVDQGSVWVGTVVTLADGQCTESTSSIAEIPKASGEPKMKVVSKLVPCSSAQAN